MAHGLAELAALVEGRLIGDGARRIDGVAGLREAGPQHISYCGHARYRHDLDHTRAGAVIVGEPMSARAETAWIEVANPQVAFAKVSQLFHPRPRPLAGVHSRAWVHPEAQVDPTATVMAMASVDRGASVGAGAVLYPGVYVGEEARVGSDTILYSNVTVRERCEVGARCIVHASAVIGSDGFGFTFDAQSMQHLKVPQVGVVRVEDDVELGAGTCIDRGTFGETVIGRGTKIDNLVQVAHNVRIGALSILCAQAGVSGSTELGQGVVLAGQVGVVGHIKVGSGVKVGAQSGVGHDVPDGATISGSPAYDHRQWLRNVVAQKQLPELLREVRQLRNRLKQLEGEKKK